MLIDINLQNFRNFKKASFKFSPKTTVVIGRNGTGKTNILESIYLISTGKSFKAKVEGEMINYDEEIARVKASIKTTDDGGSVKTGLEVVLTHGLMDIGTNNPERVPRKRLLVNGVGKRLVDFAGYERVVVFEPKDLDIVTESPSLRRKFLDSVLSLVSREYRRAVLSYEKGIRQRNRLLFAIRENPSLGNSRARLLFWDRLLIKNGDQISQMRADFLDFVNSSSLDFEDMEFGVEYDKSAISEGRLAQYAKEEVAAATTLVGPHRDDFILKIKPKKKNKSIFRELSRFGSRGEQRMGVLWLKLAELAYLEKETNARPTLLLDDIFSELDHTHREIVMDLVNKQQTVITTADPHTVRDFKTVTRIVL